MKKLFIFSLVLLSFILTYTLASAHASLLRSDPPSNAVLAVSPPSITLWFDEELDMQFSAISVLDRAQNRVDLQSLRLSDDRKQLTVNLRPNLPPGAYTVSWRVLSAVDGHITKGIFAYFIGKEAVGQAASLNVEETSALPAPAEIAVRWLNLLAAIALCGAFTLHILIGGPSEAFTKLRQQVARRHKLYVIAALVALFVGTISGILLQAATVSGELLSDVLIESIWLQTMTATNFGQAGLARILLLDALLILLFVSPTLIERWRITALKNLRAFDLLYWVLSALILLTFSLSSHGASDPLRISMMADWLHLLAIGLWTGGLFALTIVVRPALSAATTTAQTQILPTLLDRFSAIAIACVGIFSLTGLYLMWRQVGYADALIGTAYGATLITKHLFIAPMLLLGLVNTLLLRPAWQKELNRWRWLQTPVQWIEEIAARITQVASRRAPSTVLQYVRLEAALGLLAILAAAALTALPPARTALPAPPPPPFEASRQTGDLKVTLKIEPYIVGNQTFTVKVTDAQNKPLDNVQRVNLRITFLGADFGTTNVEAKLANDGSFKVEGGYLTVVGQWRAETVVRRKDIEDDARIAYRLNVIDPATLRAATLPPLNSGLIFAVLDLISGALLLAYSRRKQLPEGQWIGGGAIVLGVALFITTTFFSAPTAAEILVNPIQPDEKSLAEGQAIYEQNCLACHGAQGRGNGPLAASLTPRPADFAVHFNQHSDEVIFNWISNGVPGTAMQGYADRFTETQRWHVFNYIQSLVERGR